MKYKATVTLKKADTDGRVPMHTLDEYVRGELLRQVGTALKPHFPISRSDQALEPFTVLNQPFVDFTTELVVLHPGQWHQLKASLSQALTTLSADDQKDLQLLIDRIELS